MEERIELEEHLRELTPKKLLQQRPELANKSRTTIWRLRKNGSCRQRGYREPVRKPDIRWNARNQGWIRVLVGELFERLWARYWALPQSLKEDWRPGLVEEVMEYLLNQTGKEAWMRPYGRQQQPARDCRLYVSRAAFQQLRRLLEHRFVD